MSKQGQENASFFLIVFALFLVFTSFSLHSQQTAEELYEKALYMEEGRGDLKEAINLYQKILEKFQENREFAAKAQLHIALCLEKIGSRELQAAYQKVIDNYPDQIETVKIARERLSLLVRAESKNKRKEKIYSFHFAEPVWIGEDVNLLASPSPDSKHLSYIDSSGSVLVRELSTGKIHTLTSNGSPSPLSEYPLFSKWSPDCKQIVYNLYNKDQFFELWTIDIEDTTSTLIYKNNESVYIRPYDWSQDGQFILATLTGIDKINKIVLLSLLDDQIHILKKLNDQFPENMSFSSDGHYIVYDYPTQDEKTGRDLFILSTDGTGEMQRVEHEADDLYPSWMSDGRRIIFFSEYGGSLGVWYIHVAGSEVLRGPLPLRLSLGAVIPQGFTYKGSLFFGYSSETSMGTFSGQITKIENYFPMVSSPDHNEPRLKDVIVLGGPGDECGTGIKVFEKNLYLSGWKKEEKGEGIVAKYSLSPEKTPQLDWTVFWPNQWRPGIDIENILTDISVTQEGVYLSGYGTTYAKDDVGFLESKSYIFKFSKLMKSERKQDEALWLQCPNFFPYSGGEKFFSIIPSIENDQIYLYTGGSGQANFSNNTAILAKYGSNGEQLWWTTPGDTGPQRNSACNDIGLHQNYLYLAGYTSDIGDVEVWRSTLWKYDQDGNLVKKTADTEVESWALGLCVFDDCLYLTGERFNPNSSLFIRKYNLDGDLLWETLLRGLGGEIGKGIATDGNILYIIGETRSIGPGNSDICLLEVNPSDGSLLSFNLWGKHENDSANDIAVNGKDIYIIGDMTNPESGDTDLVLLRYRK